MKKFKVEKSQKLIDFLAEKLNISKKKAKRLIDTKNVFIDNKRVWIASYKLDKGSIVEVPDTLQQKVDIEIIYEDNFILAVNKPAFLVSDKEKNSVENLLRKKISKNIKAIHRLDKETSGVLLFAKDFYIYERFKDIWNRKYIEKNYYAISHGKALFKEKTINIKIDNKEAISLVKTLKAVDKYSLFLVKPITGKKHQIRIHLSKIGHPIVGDKLYGKKAYSKLEKSVYRHLLHAKSIRLFHPFLKKDIYISSKVADDIKDFAKFYLNFNLK